MAQTSQKSEIVAEATKKPDIQAFTNEAEAGQGCALSHQLQSLSFEETIKTLKQISLENERRRTVNPDLPEIRFETEANNGDYTGDDQLLLELDGDNKKRLGIGLLQAQWLMDDDNSDMSKIGARTDACKDWNGSKHTDEGKFITFRT